VRASSHAKAVDRYNSYMRFPLALCLFLATLAWPARAAVVVNEIFYHAPDDVDDLQWVELHNSGTAAVDVSNWSLGKSTGYVFAAGTSIPAGGFVVAARDPALFKKHYNQPALGPWPKRLSGGGGKIDLTDAAGMLVERVKYKDSDPWPVAADGYSASLERICPTAGADDPYNWQASPMSSRAPRPAGSPGKANAALAAAVPPIVRSVSPTPADPTPGQAIRVEATMGPGQSLKSVALLYHVLTDGVPGAEVSVPMTAAPPAGVVYTATIHPQKAGALVRYRIAATSADGKLTRYAPGETDLRPTFSLYVHEPWPQANIAQALVIRGKPAAGLKPDAKPFAASANPAPAGGVNEPHPPRGSAVLVYVDPVTRKTQVFDWVNVVRREGDRGFKVHLHKDARLNGQSAVGIIHEGVDRFLLNEHFAYDVYRRAGMAAPLSEFVRLTLDGQPRGYQLLIEQPNRGFLRRNKIDPDGDLYKIRWQRGDLVGQHEKRTNEHTGHAKLVALNKQLETLKGPALWKVIRENFDVDNVATYFAVNMALSHWDGYFNNYFTYQTPAGKWMMFPWDQDKTWGFHDGMGPADFFFDMPLDYGSEQNHGGPGPWWRRGGWFARPLLGNAEFRQVFVARLREVLTKVYTPEVYNPLLDQVVTRLGPDVRLRAKLTGINPDEAVRNFKSFVQALKNHLAKRREFLLAQQELRAAPAPAGAARQPK